MKEGINHSIDRPSLAFLGCFLHTRAPRNGRAIFDFLARERTPPPTNFRTLLTREIEPRRPVPRWPIYLSINIQPLPWAVLIDRGAAI